MQRPFKRADKFYTKVNMESAYSAQRKRNMFSPSDTKPYKLSRSRIENFVNCPRCFYLDRKCGTEQPPTFPYTLNNAVDTLLKKEFDLYRMAAQQHPYLVAHGIDAIPFAHDELDNWRMNQRGVQYHHVTTNFLITGAVDDVWINAQGELIVVDYKATSSMQDITLVNRNSYKRQMEIYQWLLRKNGFNVSPTGYFVYCNADAGRDHFAGTLKFKISLLPYTGDDSWIESILGDIKSCLMADTLPNAAETCDYCAYYAAISKHVEKHT
jgi:RecB family exonuclease